MGVSVGAPTSQGPSGSGGSLPYTADEAGRVKSGDVSEEAARPIDLKPKPVSQQEYPFLSQDRVQAVLDGFQAFLGSKMIEVGRRVLGSFDTQENDGKHSFDPLAHCG